jgi:hypothetical protein
MTNVDLKKLTPKRAEARASLPDELKPIFDQLVDDYRFATFEKFGNGYVAYSVLAELVRVGWRRSHEENRA